MANGHLLLLRLSVGIFCLLFVGQPTGAVNVNFIGEPSVTLSEVQLPLPGYGPDPSKFISPHNICVPGACVISPSPCADLDPSFGKLVTIDPITPVIYVEVNANGNGARAGYSENC